MNVEDFIIYDFELRNSSIGREPFLEISSMLTSKILCESAAYQFDSLMMWQKFKNINKACGYDDYETSCIHVPFKISGIIRPCKSKVIWSSLLTYKFSKVFLLSLAK